MTSVFKGGLRQQCSEGKAVGLRSSYAEEPEAWGQARHGLSFRACRGTSPEDIPTSHLQPELRDHPPLLLTPKAVCPFAAAALGDGHRLQRQQGQLCVSGTSPEGELGDGGRRVSR